MCVAPAACFVEPNLGAAAEMFKLLFVLLFVLDECIEPSSLLWELL
jgi:hypothetical protein